MTGPPAYVNLTSSNFQFAQRNGMLLGPNGVTGGSDVEARISKRDKARYILKGSHEVQIGFPDVTIDVRHALLNRASMHARRAQKAIRSAELFA